MRVLGIVNVALHLGAFTAAPLAAQRIKLPAKLEELEARARKDSNDAAAHYNIALAYWSVKRYDDAENALKRAVALDYRFAPAHLALAYLPFARRPQLWDEIGEQRVPREWDPVLEEADRRYRRAYLIDPLVDMRVIGATFPDRSVVWSIDEELSALYNYVFRGVDDLCTGKYDDAYVGFQRIINDLKGDRHPDRLPTWVLWYHGLAAAHLNKRDEAVWDFQTILNRLLAKESQRRDSLVRVPLETNQYRYVLAWAKTLAGQLDEAVRLFQEVLVNDAGLYMAHVQLASIYEANRMWDQAVVERQRAINANPDDPTLLLELGVTFVKAARLSDAEQAFHQAMEANPRDARVLYYLGIVDQQLSKKDDARSAFTRFLTLAPSRYERQIADAKQRLASLQ